MKINNQIIEETIVDLVGEDLPPLLNILLLGKANISEFKIAERLNITVNQVRSMLYRLQEYNLVDFMRKKDKRKGWYIYYWTLNKKNTFGLLKEYKRKQLEDLKNRLQREEVGGFFVCPVGCMRLKMDQAMEFDFKCQECGTLLKDQNNSRTVENIKRMIKELEIELDEPLELEGALKNVLRKRRAEPKKKIVKDVKEVPTKKAKKEVVTKKTVKKVVKKKVAKKKVVKKAVKKVVKKKVIKKKVVKKKATKKVVKEKPLKEEVEKAPKKKSFLRKVKKLIKKK